MPNVVGFVDMAVTGLGLMHECVAVNTLRVHIVRVIVSVYGDCQVGVSALTICTRLFVQVERRRVHKHKW
jgi:hypothetical protein